MTWTPPTGVIPTDRKSPSVPALADIPAMLDWLRDFYPGNTVIGVLATARAERMTYRVDGEPGYGTPGTLSNYTLTKLDWDRDVIDAALADIPDQVAAGLAPVDAALDQVADSIAATAQSSALATAAAGITPRDNLAAIGGADGYYRAMDTGYVYQRAGGSNTRRTDLEAVSAAQAITFAPALPYSITQSLGGTTTRSSLVSTGVGLLRNLVGRFAQSVVVGRFAGDSKMVNGAGGISQTTNHTAQRIYQISNAIGNSEAIQVTNVNYGPAVGVGHIVDLTVFGGTTGFASEVAVRDGNIVPSGSITEIGTAGAYLTVGTVSEPALTGGTTSYSYAFGAGVNVRSGEPLRGHPLLNYSKRMATTATLSTADYLTVTVPDTSAYRVGDYWGFDADSYALTVGTGRHLHRIHSIDSGTQFTLDSKFENMGQTYAVGYQGTATSGASAVFPAALASGYTPEDVFERDAGQVAWARRFTFNAATDSRVALDDRFAVGDVVFQMPSGRTYLYGHQTDSTGLAPQRVPVDVVGGIAVNNNRTGRKARAGYLIPGGNAGLERLIEGSGNWDYVLDNGNTSNTYKQALWRWNGVKYYAEAGNPVSLGKTGGPGSIFARADAPNISKALYIKPTGTGSADWAPVQHLSLTGYSAAALPTPTVDVPGFRLYITELDRTAEWSPTLNAWTVGGVRVIGTTAQRPTTGVPPGFKYWDTTTGAVVTLNGNAAATDTTNTFTANQSITVDSPRLDLVRPAGGVGTQLGQRYYSAPGTLAAAWTYDLTNNQMQLLNGAGVVKAALTAAGTVRYAVFTRATLPTTFAAGGGLGATALVNDAPAGKSASVWHDGTIWRYEGDNSAV